MPSVPYQTRTRGDKSGSSQRARSAKEKVSRLLSAAFRRKRTRKALTKPAKKQVTSLVKKEIGKQAETLMNFGRLLYQTSGTAQNSFEGARYWLGNIGGIIALDAQTIVPMKTINAQAVNANIASGLSAYNQTYHGKSIYGKYMRTKVSIHFPCIRTSAVGGASWETMPGNYEYRCIFFKTKPQPAINQAPSGYTNAPFSTNGFKNEVGSSFGVSSDNSDSLPDPDGNAYPWMNRDLMTASVNKTNFTVLYEKRGKLSMGSSMNATSNNASVTMGPHKYPSEAHISFTHKVNKKLNLQLETDTSQTTPGVSGVSRITNYDTSIGMFIVFCPSGSGMPNTDSAASVWNDKIEPYIHVQNSFTFTDM